MSISRDAARARARAKPTDVNAQIDAAFACDRDGFESDAIAHYDAAFALDVPAERRPEFLVGYGSTLKNVGRLAESERVLQLAAEEPGMATAARAFRALTLHAAGRSDEAVAVLVRLVAKLDDPRYRPALESYADELATRARGR